MVSHSYNTSSYSFFCKLLLCSLNREGMKFWGMKWAVVIVTDIIDEEGPDCSPVVGGGDGSVSLLAGRVPDLSFDGFPVNLNRPGGKLHPDGWFGLQIEFVPCEPWQQVGFPDSRVADQNDWKIICCNYVISLSCLGPSVFTFEQIIVLIVPGTHYQSVLIKSENISRIRWLDKTQDGPINQTEAVKDVGTRHNIHWSNPTGWKSLLLFLQNILEKLGRNSSLGSWLSVKWLQTVLENERPGCTAL